MSGETKSSHRSDGQLPFLARTSERSHTPQAATLAHGGGGGGDTACVANCSSWARRTCARLPRRRPTGKPSSAKIVGGIIRSIRMVKQRRDAMCGAKREAL